MVDLTSYDEDDALRLSCEEYRLLKERIRALELAGEELLEATWIRPAKSLKSAPGGCAMKLTMLVVRDVNRRWFNNRMTRALGCEEFWLRKGKGSGKTYLCWTTTEVGRAFDSSGFKKPKTVIMVNEVRDKMVIGKLVAHDIQSRGDLEVWLRHF